MTQKEWHSRIFDSKESHWHWQCCLFEADIDTINDIVCLFESDTDNVCLFDTNNYSKNDIVCLFGTDIDTDTGIVYCFQSLVCEIPPYTHLIVKNVQLLAGDLLRCDNDTSLFVCLFVCTNIVCLFDTESDTYTEIVCLFYTDIDIVCLFDTDIDIVCSFVS